MLMTLLVKDNRPSRLSVHGANTPGILACYFEIRSIDPFPTNTGDVAPISAGVRSTPVRDWHSL
jgi:hypothetical protein